MGSASSIVIVAPSGDPLLALDGVPDDVPAFSRIRLKPHGAARTPPKLLSQLVCGATCFRAHRRLPLKPWRRGLLIGVVSS